MAAARIDEASTTVSCSFDFAIALLHSATVTTSASQSSATYYCLPGATDKRDPKFVAVGEGLSTIELAVRKADHQLQNLDSKACPN